MQERIRLLRIRRKAGRPHGGISHAARIAQKKAKANGKLPCQLLLDWAQTGLMEKIKLTIEQRMDAAKAAAPYYSARLSSTKVMGADAGPIKIALDLADLQALPLENIKALEETLKALALGAAAPAMQAASSQESRGKAKR